MGYNISSCPLASHCHHWHCRYPKALGPYQGSVTQSSPNPVFLLCIAHKLNGKKEGGKLLREGKHGRREDDTVPLGGTAGTEPRCPQPHHHAAKNTHSPPKPSATERVKKLPRQTPCHRTVSMPVMTSGSSEMLFLEKYLSC